MIGSTSVSLANTALPLASCPVTTRLIPMSPPDWRPQRPLSAPWKASATDRYLVNPFAAASVQSWPLAAISRAVVRRCRESRHSARRPVLANVPKLLAPYLAAELVPDEEKRPVMHRDGVTLEQAYGIVTPDKPLKRAASPEEGAAVVCFLAGSEAGMMTDAVVPVDGGNTIVCVPCLLPICWPNDDRHS